MTESWGLQMAIRLAVRTGRGFASSPCRRFAAQAAFLIVVGPYESAGRGPEPAVPDRASLRGRGSREQRANQRDYAWVPIPGSIPRGILEPKSWTRGARR
jgi:hypothetical protein